MARREDSLLDDSCNINRCGFCSFQSVDKLVFVKHIFQAHNTEEGFSYTCGFLNCSRTFIMGTSFDAFRSHCTRYHDGCIERCLPTMLTRVDEDDGVETHSVTCSTNIEEGMDTNNPHTNSAEDFACLESEMVNDKDVESEMINDEDVQLAAARFILILKEKHKLTQMSLDYAIKGIEEITMLSANRFKHSVMSVLNESGSSINATLRDCLIPTSPFVNLKTEYQQNKFFKENFGLIVS